MSVAYTQVLQPGESELAWSKPCMQTQPCNFFYMKAASLLSWSYSDRNTRQLDVLKLQTPHDPVYRIGAARFLHTVKLEFSRGRIDLGTIECEIGRRKNHIRVTFS